MACINRSAQDVESLIEFAKLSTSSLLNTSQTLEFSSNYNPLENTLLQLPEKLVNVLKKGDKLILRGEPEDFAVLCTDDETYEVREAETSNSLVLVPGLCLSTSLGSQTGDNRNVVNKFVSSIHYKYLEIRPCLPRLRKLRSLLSRGPYAGPSEEESTELQLYTFSDLLSLVQCSDDQLRQALEELPALHIDGHWRVLEFDYQFAVMSALLGLLQEREWPVDAVPREQLVDAMADSEPRPVVNLCINYYFKPSSEVGAASHSSPQVCVDDDRLCRLFAEVFLRTAGKFNLTEFLDIWQLSVPPGVSTSLSQLEGLALVDRDCSPAVVWHYPVERLPEDTAERFAELFQTRDRWTLADITPYIRELSSSKCSVSALLAKHTRASTHNGIKCYSAKHSR